MRSDFSKPLSRLRRQLALSGRLRRPAPPKGEPRRNGKPLASPFGRGVTEGDGEGEDDDGEVLFFFVCFFAAFLRFWGVRRRCIAVFALQNRPKKDCPSAPSVCAVHWRKNRAPAPCGSRRRRNLDVPTNESISNGQSRRHHPPAGGALRPAARPPRHGVLPLPRRQAPQHEGGRPLPLLCLRGRRRRYRLCRPPPWPEQMGRRPEDRGGGGAAPWLPPWGSWRTECD